MDPLPGRDDFRVFVRSRLDADPDRVEFLVEGRRIDRGVFRAPSVPAPASAVASEETVVGPVGDDESWSMLGQMAGEFDVDTLSDSLGTSEAAGAEYGVYDLDAQERASLADLLRAEMGQGSATE